MPALVPKWFRQVMSHSSLLFTRESEASTAPPQPHLAPEPWSAPYPSPKVMKSLLIGSVHEIQDRWRHSSAFPPSNTSSSEPSKPALLS